MCSQKGHLRHGELSRSASNWRVGVKGGTEAAIHAANAIFNDSNIDDSQKWFLQLDFSNAFNQINRVRMLEEIRHHCPKAASWAEFCYGRHSILFFGNSRISSEEGAQQGCPLAILLFSLVLHPLLLKIKAECKDLLLNVSFLDDVTLSGTRADLQRAFDLFVSMGAEVGLHLNAQKSLVWCGNSLTHFGI